MTAQPCLTALATVYSHPSGTIDNVNHSILRKQNRYKSGLTPVDPTVDPALAHYQHQRFRKFTILQIADQKALPFLYTTLNDETLSTLEIHPCFGRVKWQKPLPANIAPFPLGLGRNGYWHASNPIVWAQLEPILKMASQVIARAQCWRWWDALLFPDFKDVPEDERPLGSEGSTLKRFFNRTTMNTPQNRKKAQEKFLRLTEDLTFGFSSSFFVDDTGAPNSENQDFHLGVTYPGSSWAKTKIWMTIECFEPLLNPDITVAERMVLRWRSALTLLHELSHALCHENNLEERLLDEGLEPYFEDEPLAEVGFSMQENIFGGVFTKVNDHISSNAFPTAGMFQCGFCNFNSVNVTGLNRQPTLLNLPRDWDKEITYPIPVEYFLKLHHSTFWEYEVMKYGNDGKRLYMGPKGNGSIYFNSDAPNDPSTRFDEEMLGDEIFDSCIAGAMNRPQILEARTVKRRRLQARQTEKELKESSTPTPISAPTIVPYQYPVYDPPCPRFDHIAKYLIMNHSSLALETMDFEISEHQLLKYVIDDGFKDLQPDEWRGFLRQCYAREVLFTWREIGQPPTQTHGIVKRIPKGWPLKYVIPAIQLRPLNPNRDFGRAEKLFLEEIDSLAMDIYLGRYLEMALRDFDKEVMRAIVNADAEELPMGMSEEDARDRVTETEFDHCIQRHPDWMFGPKGIARRKALRDDGVRAYKNFE